MQRKQSSTVPTRSVEPLDFRSMRTRLLRRGSLYRIARLSALALVAWTLIEIVYIRCALSSLEEASQLGKERIYIASIHWNNEAILRSHWIPAVLDLVKEIGPDNVFISVQESGSWDDSKGALSFLDEELQRAGVPRKIILDPTTHIDEISKPPAETGWLWTSRNKMELRRIPYLSRLRNLVMEPLHEMHEQSGTTFDKILFLNDVVFTNNDVRNLVSTRGGKYAAACSLDFSRPPRFYDTFALRDSEGHDYLMPTWPFFRARSSRRALKMNTAVPVASCWNGMVVMDAAPFYTDRLSFRGIPDSLAKEHLEGSECCLIHADNPLSRSKGVWLNPRVRVGYNSDAYDVVNPESAAWLSTLDIFRGAWKNRFLRWFTTPWFKNIIVKRRLSSWKKQDASHEEVGNFCLINEMQVLAYNGWAHV